MIQKTKKQNGKHEIEKKVKSGFKKRKGIDKRPQWIFEKIGKKKNQEISTKK